MQISGKAYRNKKTLLFLGVKVIILILIFFALFYQFKSKGIDPSSLRQSFYYLIGVPRNVFWFAFVSALVLVNWGLEALKWQLLTRNIENKTFFEAFKGVLIGLSAGIFTPLMIGDFWGRAQMFEDPNKKKSMGANLFNSLTQTYTAILLGAVSLVLFVLVFDEKSTALVFSVAVLLCFAALAGFFLITGWFVKFPLRESGFIAGYLVSVRSFSRGLIYRTLGLSVLRNLVFGLQFIVVYRMCGIETGFLQLFIGVNLIFLVKTVAGGLNVFGDLSLREIVALYFFGMFNAHEPAIAFATFLMWAINIFIPVLVGAFFIFNLKTSTQHV